MTEPASPESAPAPPSRWVSRFLPPAPPASGHVLDLAAGRGRHIRLARSQGWRVTGVERDTGALAALAAEDDAIAALEMDLEAGDTAGMAQALTAAGPLRYRHRLQLSAPPPAAPSAGAADTGRAPDLRNLHGRQRGLGTGRATRISCCAPANCWRRSGELPDGAGLRTGLHRRTRRRGWSSVSPTSRESLSCRTPPEIGPAIRP